MTKLKGIAKAQDIERHIGDPQQQPRQIHPPPVPQELPEPLPPGNLSQPFPQQVAYQRKVQQLKGTAPHGAGQAKHSRPPPPLQAIVKAHEGQGQRKVLRQKPHAAVHRNLPDPCTPIEEYRQKHPLENRQGAAGSYGPGVPCAHCHRQQSYQAVGCVLSPNRRKGEEHIGGKGRKAHIILSLVNCQLQPRIVLPQIQPALEPSHTLLGVAVIWVGGIPIQIGKRPKQAVQKQNH